MRCNVKVILIKFVPLNKLSLMPDQFTETSSTSWISRLGGSIKGIFFGILLFLGSIALLWWNEGRAVKTAKGLKEGGAAVVSVSPESIDPSKGGQLVHFSGMAETKDTLMDEQFGVNVNAIRLSREVEMYQWVETSKTETRKKFGGGEETVTTYDYAKDWRSGLNSSSNFRIQEGHQNPAALPYAEWSKSASKVNLGKYDMTGLSGSFSGNIPVSISSLDSAYLVDENYARTFVQNDGADAFIFKGNGSFVAPQVGDIRISYKMVPNGIYSVIGKQLNNTVEAYTTSYDTKILMIEQGARSAESMFESAQKSNKLIMWLLRIVGVFVMYAALMMILKPISVVADVVPFLGNIVRFGLGLAAGLVAFSISLVVIAIAWIFYRPILGISLLVAGGAIFFYFWKKAKAKKTTTVQEKS